MYPQTSICVATNIAGSINGHVFLLYINICTYLGECSTCYPPAKETLNPDPDECAVCGVWSISEEVNGVHLFSFKLSERVSVYLSFGCSVLFSDLYGS